MSTDQLDAYISQAKTKLENFNTEVKTYMSVERFDKFLFGTDTDFSFNELLDRRLDKIREFNTQVQESKQLSEQTTSQQTQTLINQQEQQLVRLQLALKNAQSGANANPNSMRAQEAVARYKEQINILQEYINKLKDVKNVQLEAEEASAQFNSSFNFIKKFAESTELTREQSEELKKLIEIYNQFHTVNNNGEIVWINQEKALSALFNAYKLIKDISPQVADELKKVINTARKTANEEQKIANETERLANNQTRLIDSGKLKEQINQVTNAARVVNQLSFAISSIQRIPNIWEDENLTTGEKLLQTVMALSMSIPNLASSF